MGTESDAIWALWDFLGFPGDAFDIGGIGLGIDFLFATAGLRFS